MRFRLVLAGAALMLAGALDAAAEKYDPGLLPRRGRDFITGRNLNKLYGALPWEIKATFKHQDGHLGTFGVGDTISLSFTVGVLGMRHSANTKSFAAPVPKLHILDKNRKTVEVISLTAGAC